MNVLRSIVKSNARNVQPLEGRKIRASFVLRHKDHTVHGQSDVEHHKSIGHHGHENDNDHHDHYHKNGVLTTP